MNAQDLAQPRRRKQLKFKQVLRESTGENIYALFRRFHQTSSSLARFFTGYIPRRSNRNTVLTQSLDSLYLLHKDANDESPVIAGDPYEPTIRLLFQALVAAGDTVLDVGANCGLHTVVLAKLCGPEGSVHAFEPVDYNIRKLNANLYLNGCKNTTIHECAVGEAECTMMLRKIRESGYFKGNSSLVDNEKLSGELSDSFDIVPVRVRTLDNIVEEAGLTDVNLIKMDIEGYEYYALQGGLQTIKRYRPIIIIEYSPARLKHMNLSNDEFNQLLGSYYDAFEICDANKYDRYMSLEPFEFDRKINSGNILLLPKCQSVNGSDVTG